MAATNGDCPFAVAFVVVPAYGACKVAAIKDFSGLDGLHGGLGGQAANGRRGVHGQCQLQRGDGWVTQTAADTGGQVPQVGGAGQAGAIRHVQGVAELGQDTNHVFNDVGVLAQVFVGGHQAVGAGLVALWVGKAGGGACQRVDGNQIALATHQQLGAGPKKQIRVLSLAARQGQGVGVTGRIAVEHIAQHSLTVQGFVQGDGDSAGHHGFGNVLFAHRGQDAADAVFVAFAIRQQALAGNAVAGFGQRRALYRAQKDGIALIFFGNAQVSLASRVKGDHSHQQGGVQTLLSGLRQQGLGIREQLPLGIVGMPLQCRAVCHQTDGGRGKYAAVGLVMT
ncbi:Uncharacterised protein [Alcaligenes faecalis subsp. faecalis]|nr:Uncharacterised protein [Alcaligenes faecalis subsp. faecalis]